ncbi:sensor histidine kinase [Streptomyces bohaiensis]|uniref:sensor histidine kinase n=1 Tax=Streptomyces bohaiensis TaxID=1431344 RepID=UPI003B8232FB
MNRTDDRFLPVLLVAAQALVWPGGALARGQVPAAEHLLAAALAALVVAGALSARRRHPVGALVVTVVTCSLVAGALPVGAVLVLGSAGVALALHGIALRRDTFTTLLTVVTLGLWQLLYQVTLHGFGDRDRLVLVLVTVLYAASCGWGIRRRRAVASAERAAHRLRRTEAERHRLAADERRRMERELHDVSAHHLTAVVVSASVAEELGDRRPELRSEALALAVAAGREVGAALGAVPEPGRGSVDTAEPRERLLTLVDGIRRLGQPVSCEVAGVPEGTAAEAAFGIVREALTNAVRHAPGAATRVECRADGDGHLVLVRNGPPRGTTGGAGGLGGGRGQAFLLSRAQEAGGTVRSAPTADGGWEVEARLPGPHGPRPEPAVPRRRRVVQVVVAVGLGLHPLLPLLIVRAHEVPGGDGVSPGLVFALAAAAQAVALLWSRSAPRAALAVVLALAVLWPWAAAVGEYGGPPAVPALLAAAAPAVGVVVYGASARRREAAAAAVGTALVQTAVAVVLVARADTAGVPGSLAALVLPSVLAAAAWAVGRRQGRHSRAAREAREARITDVTGAAVREAWAERSRITAGLETTVLTRTAAMVGEAREGRLTETAERAREALAAMRVLLDRQGATPEYAERRPQPTLEALDLLVRQSRAAGRRPQVHVGDDALRGLPPAVGLAAYRAVETILSAAGDRPVELRVARDREVLVLRATGPGAASGSRRADLEACAAALRGSYRTLHGRGAELRLPLVAVQPPDGTDGTDGTDGAPASAVPGRPAEHDRTSRPPTGTGTGTPGVPG